MQLSEIAERIRDCTAEIDALKAEVARNESLQYPEWKADNKRFFAIVDVLYQLADSMDAGHEKITPEVQS